MGERRPPAPEPQGGESLCQDRGTRTIPLNSVLMEALDPMRPDRLGEHVFTTRHEWPLRSIRTAFDTACRHAKLSGVTPHVLRLTLASRLVMVGLDLRTVMEMGGWKNLATVPRYSHLSQQRKPDTVGLLAKNSPPLFPPVAADDALQEARNINLVSTMRP